jgi:hypothetical protein
MRGLIVESYLDSCQETGFASREQLVWIFEAARHGISGIVLGPIGSGKTTLLRHIARAGSAERVAVSTVPGEADLWDGVADHVVSLDLSVDTIGDDAELVVLDEARAEVPVVPGEKRLWIGTSSRSWNSRLEQLCRRTGSLLVVNVDMTQQDGAWRRFITGARLLVNGAEAAQLYVNGFTIDGWGRLQKRMAARTTGLP